MKKEKIIALILATNVLVGNVSTIVKAEAMPVNENESVLLQDIETLSEATTVQAPSNVQVSEVRYFDADLTWNNPAVESAQISHYKITIANKLLTNNITVPYSEEGNYSYTLNMLQDDKDYSVSIVAVGTDGTESQAVTKNFRTKLETVDSKYTNLALGKLARASSEEDSNFVASKVTDGNKVLGNNSIFNRWSGTGIRTTPQWVYVDLGQPTTFNKVDIYWHRTKATAYDIQISNDLTTWNNIYTISGLRGRESDSSWRIDKNNFNNQYTGRYVRVLCNSAEATAYDTVSIVELEIYNNNAPFAVIAEAQNVTHNSANITWENPTDSQGIEKYLISDGENNYYVNYSSEGEYSHSLTNLISETEYNYTVTAIGTNGLRSQVSSVTFTTGVAPIVVNKNSLKATIDKAGGYCEVYYTTESWKVFKDALTAANNVFNSETATQPEVDLAKANLESAISLLQFVPFDVHPAPPENFRIINITETSAKLVWEAPENSPEDIVGYKIIDIDGRIIAQTGPDVREVLVNNLTPNTTYIYNVMAVGSNGVDSEAMGFIFRTLVEANGIGDVVAPEEVNRFDTAQFNLTLGKDVSKVKVIYHWEENEVPQTYAEYYDVGTSGSLTIDRKLRFARNYQVEFIPMVNGKLQKDEAQTKPLNVVEKSVEDVFGAITGNNNVGSTNIQKVGDTVQFKIETALDVDRIQFNFTTSGNYIEYYSSEINAVMDGDKLVWTIDRPIRTLRDPHKLVISAMNEGYVMASSNFEITIGR